MAPSTGSIFKFQTSAKYMQLGVLGGSSYDRSWGVLIFFGTRNATIESSRFTRTDEREHENLKFGVLLEEVAASKRSMHLYFVRCGPSGQSW